MGSAACLLEDEVERTLYKERKEGFTVLFPVRLDDSIFQIESGWASSLRQTRNIGNFTKWKEPVSYQMALNQDAGKISF